MPALPPPRLSLALLAAACVPVLAVVALGERGGPRPLAIPAEPAPSLAFSQYLVDLGKVEPAEEIRGVFRFRNRGTTPVRITKLTPSCGCLNPRLETMDYEPGDGDSLVLRMHPANEEPGQKNYYCDVEYLDPRPQKVRLSFRLQLPAAMLTVHPKALMIYQNTDAPTVEHFYVTDTRGRDVKITDVRTKSPFVTAKLLPEPRKNDQGLVEHVIEITVKGQIPEQRQHALVQIATDDPDVPTIRVPVMIQGPANENGNNEP